MFPQGVKGSIRGYLRGIGPASDEKFRRKMYVFGISLLISIALWLIIKLSQEASDSFTFRIEYSSWPEAFVPVQVPDSSVEVTISSTGFRLLSMSLNRSSRILYADLEDGKVVQTGGARLIRINVEALLAQNFGGESAGLFTFEVNPPIIEVDLDTKLSTRLPVIPQIDIILRKQYDLMGRVRTEPDSVTLSGPASLISGLHEVKTKNSTIPDAHEDISRDIGLILPGPLVSASPARVTLKAHIEGVTEKVIEVTLPAKAEGVEGEFIVLPAHVSVHLSLPLSSFDKVEAGDIQLSLARTGIGSYLKVSVLSLPQECKLIRVDPSEVEYYLSP